MDEEAILANVLKTENKQSQAESEQPIKFATADICTHNTV